MKLLLKVALKYGVIGGVLGTVLLVILFYMNRHPFLLEIFVDFRILLFMIFMFFMLRELRDFHQAGELYFWQGLIATFLFTFIFGVVAACAIWIFGSVVPEFVTLYIKQAGERARALPPELIEQIGKDVYERNLAALPSTNISGMAVKYFLQSFLIGFFIGLVLSLVLRRQPKPF